jgi:hypothetical protein
MLLTATVLVIATWFGGAGIYFCCRNECSHSLCIWRRKREQQQRQRQRSSGGTSPQLSVTGSSDGQLPVVQEQGDYAERVRLLRGVRPEGESS